MTERDPFEERLSAAMHEYADDVHPRGDGLTRIRARTARKRRWAFLAHPAMAALGSVAVVAIAVSATALGTGKIPTPFAGSTTQGSSATSQQATATQSGAKSTKPGKTEKRHRSTKPTEHTHRQTHTAGHPTVRTDVPVYSATKSGDQYVLTKETRQVALPDVSATSQPAKAEAAIDSMLDDPGAPSLWSSGTDVVNTQLSGSTLAVDLSSSATSGASGPVAGDQAQAALRQLVYTGTAAAPSASAVQLSIEGQPVTQFRDLVPVSSAGISRSDTALTRPLNAISAPADGDSVGSPVSIEGSGTYGGSTAAWQILQDGQVIQSGTTTVTAATFSSWSASATLGSGSYTVKTYDPAATGDQNAVTHQFTVVVP